MVYNRLTDHVECFYEGVSKGTVGISSSYRNFRRVLVRLKNHYDGDWGQLDIDETCKSFASAASPGEMRELLEHYVGPMVLNTDGTVAQKETTPDKAEVVVKRPLAGARYATRHIRTAFWQRFKRVA